jgi:hypothetical protein
MDIEKYIRLVLPKINQLKDEKYRLPDLCKSAGY